MQKTQQVSLQTACCCKSSERCEKRSYQSGRVEDDADNFVLLMSRLVSHPSTTNHPTCNHSAPLEEGKKGGKSVITAISNTYFSYISILLKKKLLKNEKCPCLFYITIKKKKIIHLFSQSNIMYNNVSTDVITSCSLNFKSPIGPVSLQQYHYYL